MSFENIPLSRSTGLIGVIACCVLLVLGACTSSRAPLKISNISVHPDPIIGQTVTLSVEVVSSRDEPEAYIIIGLPPGVKHMGGDLSWEGSLSFNQPQSHEISICVLYEGDWRLGIRTYSILSENSSYQDYQTLHLITKGDSVRVVPGGEYRITQPPGGMVHPTDVPKTPPVDICP